MGEMGAHAQTGPLRLGIVGQAPEHRFCKTVGGTTIGGKM